MVVAEFFLAAHLMDLCQPLMGLRQSGVELDGSIRGLNGAIEISQLAKDVSLPTVKGGVRRIDLEQTIEVGRRCRQVSQVMTEEGQSNQQ